MQKHEIDSDLDIRGSMPALKRAARNVRQLAEATGALLVMKDGKSVNLNPAKKRSRKID